MTGQSGLFIKGLRKRRVIKIKISNLKEHYMFGSEEVVGFSDDVGFNTDDKPVLEFLVAENLYLTKQQQCTSQRGIKIKGR